MMGERGGGELTYMKQAAAHIAAVTHKSHGSLSPGDHQCQHDTMCQAGQPPTHPSHPTPMTSRDLGGVTRFMLHETCGGGQLILACCFHTVNLDTLTTDGLLEMLSCDLGTSKFCTQDIRFCLGPHVYQLFADISCLNFSHFSLLLEVKLSNNSQKTKTREKH